MKATAELSSRAEKAKPDIVLSCICSNSFVILISFNLIYYHKCKLLYSQLKFVQYLAYL